MLIVSRKVDQALLCPHLGIEVRILDIRRHTVKVGISAPRSVHIIRRELHEFRKEVSLGKDEEADRATAGEPVDAAHVEALLEKVCLAAYLASNQISHDRSEYAKASLDRAMEALDQLRSALRSTTGSDREAVRSGDRARRSSALPEVATSVREPITGYQVSKGSTGTTKRTPTTSRIWQWSYQAAN